MIQSTFSKLRCGILPLQIKVLRWQGVPADRRFCVLCKDRVEDEAHFLFDCPNYTELRREFINTIFTIEELSTKKKIHHNDAKRKHKNIQSVGLRTPLLKQKITFRVRLCLV